MSETGGLDGHGWTADDALLRRTADEFLDLCGSTNFWQGPGQIRSRALDGLCRTFLFAEDPSPRTYTMFETLMDNYFRRAELVAMSDLLSEAPDAHP